MQDDDDYIGKTLAGEWASLRNRIAELESQLAAGTPVLSKSSRTQAAAVDDIPAMNPGQRRPGRTVSSENEERMFSQVFAMLPEAVLIVECGPDRILEANAAAAVLFGFERQELAGLPYSRFLAGRDEIPPAAVTGMSVNMRKRNGEVFTAEIAGNRLVLQGRDIFAAVVRKASGSSRARSDLELRCAFLENIMDASPDFLIVLDKQARIVFANRAWGNIVGIPMENLIGKSAMDCIPDREAAEGMYRSDLEILNGGAERTEFRCRFRTACGRKVELYAVKAPIRNAEGDIDQMIAVGLDAAERDHLPLAVEQARVRELEEANAEMRSLLKNREQDRQELLDNIVINIEELILPSIQRLDGTGLDEVQRTYVDMLKSALRQMSAPFRNKLVRKQGLSPMEMQVASLIKAGKGNKEIAEILGVSRNTVMTHRYHLRTKLGVKGEKVNLRTFLNSTNGSSDKSRSPKDH